MKEGIDMEKIEQMGMVLKAFSDAYKTQDWKNTVKESTNYVSSDEAFDAYKPRIYSFNDIVYSNAKSNLPKVEDEFEIVDNDDEMGKTMFGMTMLNRADNMFGVQTPVEKVETPHVDNVSDNSFIISMDELANLPKQEVRPMDSFTEALTPIVEEVKTPVIDTPTIERTPIIENVSTPVAPVQTSAPEQVENEVVSFEEEKAKVKTLGKLKKAGYIDTVILCLIAQLSIFGLLIIVLLIIK